MVNPRFQLEEEVMIKKTRNTGIVKQYRYDTFLKNGVKTEIHQYWVKFSNNQTIWFKEDELVSVFSDKFESGLLDLLIDTNLGERNFDVVKKLQQEKERRKGLS